MPTTTTRPTTEIDPRYSSPDASATEWGDAVQRLERAEVFFLATVRADGRPHVTPLIAVWHDGALYFCTGEDEQKARNVRQNPHVTLMAGTDAFEAGLDVMVEGDAVRVTDNAKLQRLADEWVSKYGEDWRFVVRDGAFYHGEESVRSEHPAAAHVFEVAPVTARGFGKGEAFSQTRWTFNQS